MHLTKRFILLALVVAAAAGGLDARNVFVMPGSGAQGAVVFAGDPLGNPITIPAPNGAFLALARPDGARYYILSRTTGDSLLILDGNFNVISRAGVGEDIKNAAITPDGKKLVVLTNMLRVFDTETGNEIRPTTMADIGAAVLDMAISQDSKRVFVLSPSAQRVIAVDISTSAFQMVGSVFLGGGEYSGIAVGPNGLVYASLTNQVVVIDPVTVTRLDPVIGANGLPGRLSFTPDGLRAIAINRQIVTGASAFVFDLASRAASTVPNMGQALEEIQVAGNNRAFGLSNGSALYDISLSPPAISQAALPGVVTSTGVTGFALSDELPAARYLYVAVASGVNRIDLGSNLEGGRVAIGSATGKVSFAGPASLGPAVSGVGYNNSQTVLPSTALLPLIARFIDATGRPVAGAPVSFSSPSAEVQFTQKGTVTTAAGFVQATVTAPATLSTYTVEAVSGTAKVQFGFIVTSSTGGGGGTVSPTGGGIFIVSGNGQLAPEQAAAGEPMVVLVKNPDGTPAVGQQVTFEVVQGPISLSPVADYTCGGLTCATDSKGKTGMSFVTSSIGALTSFTGVVVKASLSSGVSVPFNHTVYLRFRPDGTPALEPQIEVIQPQSFEPIVGQVGTTKEGAIKARVVAGGVLQIGQPIPNVAIAATTGLDAASGPVASCQPTALSDSSGLMSCDLTFGGKLGQADLTVTIGSNRSYRRVVEVRAGPPTNIRILQGNNQAGNPGQKLPMAVFIEVSDSAGNLLENVPITWEVVQAGTLTLSNARAVTDANGRAQAEVTLGQVPGVVVLRAKAGAAAAVFNFTVNVRITKLSKISGDGQLAIVNQAFAQPLVVQVLDDQNRPVPGAQVGFSAASGSASVNPVSATTDANGRASTSVIAGPVAGPIQIRVGIGTLTETFSLTSRLPGATVTASDFRNAASNSPGITPGGIAIVRGSGIAPGNQGLQIASLTPGRLPTQFLGVEIQFGGVSAPIFWINSQSGIDEVALQVPFEVAAGTTSVLIRSTGGGTSTISNVPVLPIHPGIFETGAGSQRMAVATRPDGSFVSADNPAQRGEVIRVYATGLGQTSPATGTNRAGVAGQSVLASVVGGVNNEGARVVSAETLPGSVGIYAVAIEISATTAAGPAQPLALLVTGPDGNQVFSNGTQIPIR